MGPETVDGTYHVLLIGIDSYPAGFNSLSGCVNDIDNIEKLLLDPPGVGVPSERIRITRLAAPGPQYAPSRPSQAPALPPTRANVVQALQGLAGPAVAPGDRVLIYYSGHGDETLWKGSNVWHEALCAHDGHDIQYLFDVEMNGLIGAIARRTEDLTVVLDCCHSAGATRDLNGVQRRGKVRSLASGHREIDPPDLSALNLAPTASGARMLQSATPNYLVVVACQPDEKANEGAYPFGTADDGVFTYSLMQVMNNKDAAQRAATRWADIWPALLTNVAGRNGQLGQPAQHPWMIGRTERKVFGGSWEPMDPGYQLARRPDGKFDIAAGSLMGVTAGAEIAVYGSKPRLFPAVGSAEDRPIGRLKVESAGPSTAVGLTIGVTFVLPQGARGRLVKPGDSQRLRVSLSPEDANLKTQLEASRLLEVVPPADPQAEVEVIAQAGGWVIGNDVEPVVAVVPAGEVKALVAGLEHYYRYNTVLRMARNCNDPQLDQSLAVQVLDCNDAPKLASMPDEDLADPALPEGPRDQDGFYNLPEGFKFCVKVTNHSREPLNVTLLSCSAGGLVEGLSQELLRADNAAQVLWLDGQIRSVFEAGMDDLPPAPAGFKRRGFSTERMVAIATTRRDVTLDYLKLDKRVQEVVDENLSMRAARGAAAKQLRRSTPAPAAPAELWTAAVTHVRIHK